MDNVTSIHPERDPDETLKKSIGKYKEILILGVTEEGALVASSSGMSINNIIMAFEQIKLQLLLVSDEYE